jgi:hypothetical protein
MPTLGKGSLTERDLGNAMFTEARSPWARTARRDAVYPVVSGGSPAAPSSTLVMVRFPATGFTDIVS